MRAFSQKESRSNVRSVAFRPDGQILVSSSADGTIKLWDVATGEDLRTLTGHTYDIRSVAFSPDGLTLASGSYDKTIKLWHLAKNGAPSPGIQAPLPVWPLVLIVRPLLVAVWIRRSRFGGRNEQAKITLLGAIQTLPLRGAW